ATPTSMPPSTEASSSTTTTWAITRRTSRSWTGQRAWSTCYRASRGAGSWHPDGFVIPSGARDLYLAEVQIPRSARDDRPLLDQAADLAHRVIDLHVEDHFPELRSRTASVTRNAVV